MRDPARRMTLLEYMHAKRLRARPACFYCGLPATALDHSRPRSRGGHPFAIGNLRPACRRCNTRKSYSPLAAFRKRLERIARLWRKERGLRGEPHAIIFHGEGARGPSLRHLRDVLERATLSRSGALRVVAAGEPLSKTKTRTEAQRAKDRERPRWRGRFTFHGFRALRALAAKTGCSFPVIERFVLGLPGLSTKRLETACGELKLDVKALRAMTPPTSSGKPKKKKVRRRRRVIRNEDWAPIR